MDTCSSLWVHRHLLPYGMFPWHLRFQDQWIAVYVFDKRGLGKSEVKYVSNNSASGLNLKLLVLDSKLAINLIAKASRFENISLDAIGIS